MRKSLNSLNFNAPDRLNKIFIASKVFKSLDVNTFQSLIVLSSYPLAIQSSSWGYDIEKTDPVCPFFITLNDIIIISDF